MLAKFTKITTLKAAIIIAVIGLVVFASGLTSPFMGDDIPQIVNNPPVHSIANIPSFFNGGTFYNGQGSEPLAGTYYRPLMTVSFSLLYWLFGPNAVAFHVIQLLLYLLSVFMIFLFLRYSFKPSLALGLALVFLIHPINSQAVYSIAALQDVLCFLFGMVALWLLLRFDSRKSLILVVVSLALSLLAKESGILFVGIALVYCFWFNRQRFLILLGPAALMVIAYVALRGHAVGFANNPQIAPIDDLTIWGRLATVPAILLFYGVKFMFPLHLAQAYYWVYPGLTLNHFFVPLTIDLGVASLMIYAGRAIKTRLKKPQFLTFLFFSLWFVAGLLPHLQIIPLDMTVCETWFMFPMVGLLGMIGVASLAFSPRLPRWAGTGVLVLIVVLLGARTALRGLDWNDQYRLAYRDVAASKGDYVADKRIADDLLARGEPEKAKLYAQRSVDIYPTALNYDTLGNAYIQLGDYPRAGQAYTSGIRRQPYYVLYEHMAALSLFYGDPGQTKRFIQDALRQYPQDGTLWFYLAILEGRGNDDAGAKAAIARAYQYDQSAQITAIYHKIMNGQTFSVEFKGAGR